MRRTDLPPMAHCTACGECCTVVKARPEEAKRIRAYVREHDVKWQPPAVVPKTDYKTDVNPFCGFLRPQPDGTWACVVYPVRPWGCRAFGVIADMQCEYFPEDAVLDMSAKEAVMLRLTDPADRDLGEYFEPGYLQRIEPVLAENATRFALTLLQRGDIGFEDFVDTEGRMKEWLTKPKNRKGS